MCITMIMHSTIWKIYTQNLIFIVQVSFLSISIESHGENVLQLTSIWKFQVLNIHTDYPHAFALQTVIQNGIMPEKEHNSNR